MVAGLTALVHDVSCLYVTNVCAVAPCSKFTHFFAYVASLLPGSRHVSFIPLRMARHPAKRFLDVHPSGEVRLVLWRCPFEVTAILLLGYLVIYFIHLVAPQPHQSLENWASTTNVVVLKIEHAEPNSEIHPAHRCSLLYLPRSCTAGIQLVDNSSDMNCTYPVQMPKGCHISFAHVCHIEQKINAER